MNRTVLAVGLAAVTIGGLGVYRRKWIRERSFAGKVVAITGGSRGLGLEMARLWRGEGAKVAVCARRKTELKKAARELGADDDGFLTIPCDITERDQAKAFVEQIVDHWGTIDVLVNNAGIIQAGPVDCMTLEDFESTMATHFWGPLYLIQAALPFMRANGGGKIVNIASIGGEISVPHLVPYSASKFALVGLSEGLSAELRSAGIEILTVCPGLMRTGSPRNAEFKGNHRAEYAWFSISDSLPIISISSRFAARRIVAACRRGRRHLRLSLPAKAAVPFRAVFPNLTSRVLSLINRLLPESNSNGARAKHGYESFSAWSPSVLTHLTEKAAQRNNEMR
jgi:NAD(P)-dependent dehydrogenase (short-subunit alcohol dehydrogenase family)